jgi:polyketide biosynthesis acyl carrier protein
MTREEIFTVVRAHLLQVLPGLAEAAVRGDFSMHDLGADSLDRMDVISATTDELHIEVPTDRLADAHNIDSLVDVLYEYTRRPVPGEVQPCEQSV